MKKNTKIKLAGVILGAALSSTGAYAANASCGAKGNSEAKKMEKKVDGSCGGDAKKEANKMAKKVDGSCGGDATKEANKKATNSTGSAKCG